MCLCLADVIIVLRSFIIHKGLAQMGIVCDECVFLFISNLATYRSTVW